MAVSAGSRIATLLWVAAVLIAAVPASAQTNDPSLTEEDLDCLRRQAAGGPDCVPGETPEDSAAQPDEFVIQTSLSCGRPDAETPDKPGTAANPGADATTADPAAAPNPNAVLLPELIVDLFPQPSARFHARAARSRRARGSPDATPASPPPAEPPAAPPPGSLAVAPPTVSPVAITGDFVPDEVLVAVDGDASVAADIAAAFGLEVRSQRASTLLGSTVVRYGIPDGRPVGIVLAQLADDGRTTAGCPITSTTCSRRRAR